MKNRELVGLHRAAILLLAEQHQLENVRLFGSAARGDDDSDSDVDLVVRRKPGSDAWLMYDFEEAVSELLGRKVDVIVEAPLMRERLLTNIRRDAVPV
jgi:uncharacterized protein